MKRVEDMTPEEAGRFALDTARKLAKGKEQAPVPTNEAATGQAVAATRANAISEAARKRAEIESRFLRKSHPEGEDN